MYKMQGYAGEALRMHRMKNNKTGMFEMFIESPRRCRQGTLPPYCSKVEGLHDTVNLVVNSVIKHCKAERTPGCPGKAKAPFKVHRPDRLVAYYIRRRTGYLGKVANNQGSYLIYSFTTSTSYLDEFDWN